MYLHSKQGCCQPTLHAPRVLHRSSVPNSTLYTRTPAPKQHTQAQAHWHALHTPPVVPREAGSSSSKHTHTHTSLIPAQLHCRDPTAPLPVANHSTQLHALVADPGCCCLTLYTVSCCFSHYTCGGSPEAAARLNAASTNMTAPPPLAPPRRNASASRIIALATSATGMADSSGSATCGGGRSAVRHSTRHVTARRKRTTSRRWCESWCGHT